MIAESRNPERSPDSDNDSSEESDHVPLLQRPLRKLHTISCAGDLSSQSLQQRRRSSIIGFEVTVPDARRSSQIFGPKGFQKRRSSVIGCETASMVHRLTVPVLNLSDVHELQDDDSKSSSSLVSSRSSLDSDSDAEASRPASTNKLPQIPYRNFNPRSTLHNATEASRMRDELTVITPHIHRRSSVLSIGGMSSSSRFSAHSSNRTADQRWGKGVGAPNLGRRASVIGPRFRTQSTLDFMQAISHECLKDVDLFKTCDLEFVEMLIELARAQLFQVDHELVKQGETANAMYILAHGTIETRVGENVVDTRSAVCVLGHEAMLSETTRSVATICSKTFCDCRVIQRDGLMMALGSFPLSRAVLQTAAKKYITALSPKSDADRWERHIVSRPHSAVARLSIKSPFRKSLALQSLDKNKSSDGGMNHSQQSGQFDKPGSRRRSSVIGFERTFEDHRRGSAVSDGRRSGLIVSGRRTSVLGLPGLTEFLAQLPELEECGHDTDSSSSSSSSISQIEKGSDSEDEPSKAQELAQELAENQVENSNQSLSGERCAYNESTSERKDRVANLVDMPLDEMQLGDAVAKSAKSRLITSKAPLLETSSSLHTQPPPFWSGLTVMKTVRWRSFGRPARRHKGLTIPMHCSKYSTFRTRPTHSSKDSKQELQRHAVGNQLGGSGLARRASRSRVQPVGEEPMACDFADLLEQCSQHVRTEWPDVQFWPFRRKTCFTSGLNRLRLESNGDSVARQVDGAVPASARHLPKLVKHQKSPKGRTLGIA